MGGRGTIVFSQPLNWDLTVDVMAGSWKGRKTKIGSDKEVSVFQDHKRELDLFEDLAGNFLKNQWRKHFPICSTGNSTIWYTLTLCHLQLMFTKNSLLDAYWKILIQQLSTGPSVHAAQMNSNTMKSKSL